MESAHRPSRSAQETGATTDQPAEIALAQLPTYRKLWRNTVILTLLVAFIPLIVLAIVNYDLDRDAMRLENEFDLLRILSNTKHSLEQAVQEKHAALSLVISELSAGELDDPGRLNRTLQHVNAAFGGFVDISTIRPDGNLLAHASPYPTGDTDYGDQTWFHEVLLTGLHVSEVFQDDRGFSQFRIAFKHERDGGGFIVVRATLDVALLTRGIFSLRLDRNTDVFITNRDGLLQTESAFFGPALTPTDISIPPHCCVREVIEAYEEDGKGLLRGFASVDRTPFILATVQRRPNPLRHWLANRASVIWFALISAALILVVILYGSSSTVRRLRRADQKRVRVMHNLEYTSKLATIGRMAAGVAHEINNPLAVISENAGLLQDMVESDADSLRKTRLLDLARAIDGSVQRCSAVTHRLLGFARRMDVRAEPTDLEELLKEVVGFQETEAAHRNIRVHYHFAPDLPSVQSDRGQLQQVFLNLISNAFAAVGDGGVIQVIGERTDDGQVAVTVRDNGVGIPAEDMDKIFEPFFSTKGEFGTGLGLSITHDIVVRLGGRIDVESVRGAGTNFIVTLPLTAPAPTPAEPGDE